MRELLLRHRQTLATVLGIALPLFLLYVHGLSERKTTIIEAGLVRLTSPAQAASHRIFKGLGDLWGEYVSLSEVAEENALLKEVEETLKQKLVHFEALEVENKRLREELRFRKARRDLKMVGAHVIGKDLSPYGRVLRIAIDVGEEQAIEEGMIVVNADGLVGRITRVGGRYAEVLLVVDARSVVNVRVLNKGVTGTVTGTSSAHNYVARLAYLHRAEPLEVGDILVTSGHDQVYPPGLKVGFIRSLEERQHGIEYELHVTPSVNLGGLEEVQVILGVQDEDIEAPTEEDP